MIRRENDARLIWQIYCEKSVAVGNGKMQTWEWLEDRDAFIDAVSAVITDRYENVVTGLADRLAVGVDIRRPARVSEKSGSETE